MFYEWLQAIDGDTYLHSLNIKLDDRIPSTCSGPGAHINGGNEPTNNWV